MTLHLALWLLWLLVTLTTFTGEQSHHGYVSHFRHMLWNLSFDKLIVLFHSFKVDW